MYFIQTVTKHFDGIKAIKNRKAFIHVPVKSLSCSASKVTKGLSCLVLGLSCLIIHAILQLTMLKSFLTKLNQRDERGALKLVSHKLKLLKVDVGLAMDNEPKAVVNLSSRNLSAAETNLLSRI